MIHTPRRIVANTMIYTGTLVIQKIISFLYFWFLSSRLQPERLGTYIWALSLTTLFSIGLDLGLSPILIRESARDDSRTEHLLRGTLGLKVLFSIVTLLLLVLVLFVSNRDPVTIMVVGVATFVMIFDSFAMSFWSVMRARQVVTYESVGMLSFHILVFALGAYLLHLDRSPLLAMTALATGSGAMLLFSWIVVRIRFRLRTLPSFHWDTMRELVHLLPAFAFSGIFVRIYNAADTILLGYLASTAAVGLYSVPAKVVTALQMLIPGAFIASVYPAMSHYFKTSRPRLEELFLRAMGYLAVLAFPLMVGLLVLIPSILSYIWPEYLTVSNTFMIMTLALPFLFFSFPTGYCLNAVDAQKKNTTNRGIVTALNIILNVLLIPILGVLGAGIAFLITNVTLLFLDLRAVRKVLPMNWKWFWQISRKAMAASIIMGILVWALKGTLPLLALILLGGVVYGMLLVLLRTFSAEEWRLIRELFKKPSPPLQDVSRDISV